MCLSGWGVGVRQLCVSQVGGLCLAVMCPSGRWWWKAVLCLLGTGFVLGIYVPFW
jgi:hypothetical protein